MTSVTNTIKPQEYANFMLEQAPKINEKASEKKKVDQLHVGNKFVAKHYSAKFSTFGQRQYSKKTLIGKIVFLFISIITLSFKKRFENLGSKVANKNSAVFYKFVRKDIKKEKAAITQIVNQNYIAHNNYVAEFLKDIENKQADEIDTFVQEYKDVFGYDFYLLCGMNNNRDKVIIINSSGQNTIDHEKCKEYSLEHKKELSDYISEAVRLNAPLFQRLQHKQSQTANNS